jgi:hypothetical protein
MPNFQDLLATMAAAAKALALIVALMAAPGAAAAQATGENYCPPDGSSIAIFTRQAFDQGREVVGRRYGKFVGELAQIAMSNEAESQVVEQSNEAAKRLAAEMQSLGHEISVGEIVVHREGQLVFQIQIAQHPVAKARYALQLAVVQEMKRAICQC